MWCGVIRCGVVWCGVVGYGLEWCCVVGWGGVGVVWCTQKKERTKRRESEKLRKFRTIFLVSLSLSLSLSLSFAFLPLPFGCETSRLRSSQPIAPNGWNPTNKQKRTHTHTHSHTHAHTHHTHTQTHHTHHTHTQTHHTHTERVSEREREWKSRRRQEK